MDGGRNRLRTEEVQRGRVGGGVFRVCVSRSRSASTVFSGGGRGDERQTRKHTFFGGSLPNKWISVPRFCGLWTMPKAVILFAPIPIADIGMVIFLLCFRMVSGFLL